MTDTPQHRAEILAAKLVAEACERSWTRTMTFSVMSDGKPVPFAFHWKLKGTSGVTFKKTETAAAKAWIVTALLAGFGVCAHWSGQRGGGGGIYWLNEDRRGQS
jgi:hypothetical protein